MKIKLWMAAGYPAISIVGGILLSTAPGGSFTSVAPVMFGCLIAWLVIAIVRASQRSTVSLELSPDMIRIGRASARWSEIIRAERKGGIVLPTNTLITLFAKAGTVEIPAGIDAQEYVWAVIEGQVKNAVTK